MGVPNLFGNGQTTGPGKGLPKGPRKATKKALENAPENTPENAPTMPPANGRPSSSDRPSSSSRRSCSGPTPSSDRPSSSDRAFPNVPNNFVSYDLTSTNIYDYADLAEIPPITYPFISGYLDVFGDGNCGYRVISDGIWGSQNFWAQVREFAVAELYSEVALYTRMFSPEGYLSQIDRITWATGGCERPHWLQLSNDLFPIATALNATIVSLQQNLTLCCTVLPLRALDTPTGSVTGPSYEIAIAYIHAKRHFIRLHLQPNFPMPPIIYWWTKHHQPSVNNWDNIYGDRLRHWRALIGEE